MKNEHLKKIKTLLKDIKNLNGSILYSGYGTLKRNDFYIMGLNPGGSPEDGGDSLLQSIENRFSCAPDYCSYLKDDEPKWDRENLRTSVLKIAATMNRDIRTIFSSNAIFMRSKNATLLPGDATELFNQCWPVHEYFLSIVHPSVILCLGNGASESSFSFLHQHSQIQSSTIEFINGKSFRGGKKFFATINLGADLNSDPIFCEVIGIPHPSRFAINKDLLNYLARVSQRFSI